MSSTSSDASSTTPPAPSSQDLLLLLRTPNSLEEMRTPLHAAASGGHAGLSHLLLLHGADPCALDACLRPPVLLAPDKATRDAFRRARAELGEERWEWTRAGVAAALSREAQAQAQVILCRH